MKSNNYGSKKWITTVFAMTGIFILTACGRLTSADCVYGIGAALLFYNGANVYQKRIYTRKTGVLLDDVGENKNG